MKKLIREALRLLVEKTTLHQAEAVFAKYGVPNASSLSKEKLNVAYKKLARKYHPDINPINSEIISRINDARDVLLAHVGRHKYDSYSSHRTQSNRNGSYDRNDVTSHPSFHDYEPWSWAGYSGGIPNSDTIRSGADINYFKKKAWEISGRPTPSKNNEYTFWNFDGHYSRGVFSVYAVPETLFEISKMMIEWDNFNRSRAVLFSHHGDFYVINVGGKEVDPPHPMKHDSFNRNAFNDRYFVAELERFIENYPI